MKIILAGGGAFGQKHLGAIRCICDTGTYIAHDGLVGGKDQKFDVSMNRIELRERFFFAAIRENREPNSSVRQALSCYRMLADLERQPKSQG